MPQTSQSLSSIATAVGTVLTARLLTLLTLLSLTLTPVTLGLEATEVSAEPHYSLLDYTRLHLLLNRGPHSTGEFFQLDFRSRGRSLDSRSRQDRQLNPLRGPAPGVPRGEPFVGWSYAHTGEEDADGTRTTDSTTAKPALKFWRQTRVQVLPSSAEEECDEELCWRPYSHPCCLALAPAPRRAPPRTPQPNAVELHGPGATAR